MTYLCHAFETDVIGRLAQLVQSVCLTSRGSGVRIPQRPPTRHQTQSQKLRALSSAGSERLPYKQRVGGSNPSAPTPKGQSRHSGRLAQLVQSICLTDRGSAVRIRQRPHPRRGHRHKTHRALSSAGSERLPYKQRVGGSNPSAPTRMTVPRGRDKSQNGSQLQSWLPFFHIPISAAYGSWCAMCLVCLADAKEMRAWCRPDPCPQVLLKLPVAADYFL